MDLLVQLLYATLLLFFLAAMLVSLGLVGLAFRWVLQVWSGGGSHRPFDKDTDDASQGSAWRRRRPRERAEDEVDAREII